MYVAKRTGKGRVEVFEPEMRVKALHRTALQQELALAVERGEIDVAYQPVIDVSTGRPSMLEALARWRRPGQPPVPADVFIALAEESGAINKIGLEVLRRACRAGERWRHLTGCDALGIAVNVSVHQILAGHLADQVVEALRDSASRRPGSPWRSPRAPRSATPTAWPRSSPACRRWECASRSTTSARATRRWAC